MKAILEKLKVQDKVVLNIHKILSTAFDNEVNYKKMQKSYQVEAVGCVDTIIMHYRELTDDSILNFIVKS